MTPFEQHIARTCEVELASIRAEFGDEAARYVIKQLATDLEAQVRMYEAEAIYYARLYGREPTCVVPIDFPEIRRQLREIQRQQAARLAQLHLAAQRN